MAKDELSARQAAYKFLSTSKNAAVSTVTSKNRSYVTMVSYLINEKLRLYFVTGVESQKYRNILVNPNVSMVIYKKAPRTLTSVQLSGKAKRIDNLRQEQEAIEKLSRRAGKDTPVPFLELYNRGIYNELALIEVIPSEMTIGVFSTKANDEKNGLFTTVIRKQH